MTETMKPIRIEGRYSWAELWLGDCLGVDMPLAALTLTDPPYGIGEDGGACRTRKKPGVSTFQKRHWDNEPPPAEAFRKIIATSRSQIIWGGNYFTDKLPVSRGWLYWDKLMGGDFSDGELAWTSFDMVLRKFTFCNKGQHRVHPAQKPVPLMAWCLKFAKLQAGETVQDFYAGSGSTGVACAQLHVNFRGVERDPDYFAISERRIRQELESQLI